ncbi:MAG: hypothetical protein ABW104_18130 [Candidatus Thiodiazotropha sp. 6PLUC2]|nr:hypothetical protein [Candidatus Thiodiazotropha lotti]MCW4221999.1 hypothetical protein [Candidatus Thiodiazotropha lotti]
MRKPTRRNRNIGTKKSGYSQDNNMVIPQRKDDLAFWEQLNNPVIIPIKAHDHEIAIFVEPVRDGYIHACTPQDIIKILELLPPDDVEEVEIIVLRQPKKKEEILSPVWGRYLYYVDFDKYNGSAICIEAIKPHTIVKWGSSLSPFEQKELKLLEQDGDRIEQVKRGWNIHTTPESVRNRQLYRTLPHEFGHAVDYARNCLEPCVDAKTEEEDEYISKVFDSKPTLEKEEFANRYAKAFYEKHFRLGNIPFNRVLNEDFLEKHNLDIRWFQES